MNEEINAKPLDKGLFIVLEGIDGSGKTTQAKRLVDAFLLHGIDAIFTREPTGGQWGQKIRGIADKGRENVSLEQELEWFHKDREEHIINEVRPALDAGKVVVCDRYYYSTMAYQGALGADVEKIRATNEQEYKFPKPDLVIYIDIEPWQGLERIEKGRDGGANEGYEKSDFLQKVKANFDAMDDDNFVRTPGMGCQRAINKQIADIVRDKFGIDLSGAGTIDLSCGG